MHPVLDHPSRILPLGSFFGRPSVERTVGAMMLAERAADPSRVIERHAHEDAHFVLVLDGDYRTSARGGDRRDGAPLLVYNPPGTVHCDRFARRDGVFTGHFFTLSVPASMEGDGSGRPLHQGEPRTLVQPLATTLARQLVRECRRWDPVAAHVAESLALELLALADADDGRSPDLGNASGVRPHTAPSWLYRAVEQLVDRCTSDVSIGDVARDVGVHPVHVARAFRRWVGCTPGELLRRRRTARALVALRSTTLPLSQVAAECGFTDQSHLTRAVRRSTGTTPLAYRVAHLGRR